MRVSLHRHESMASELAPLCCRKDLRPEFVSPVRYTIQHWNLSISFRSTALILELVSPCLHQDLTRGFPLHAAAKSQYRSLCLSAAARVHHWSLALPAITRGSVFHTGASHASPPASAARDFGVGVSRPLLEKKGFALKLVSLPLQGVLGASLPLQGAASS